MTRLMDDIHKLTPLQRAVFALKEKTTRLESLERAQSEPVAIVGIACRFPGGVTGPDSYWQLLCNGVDVIGPIPPDRWDADTYYNPDPLVPGKMNTRFGGFIDDVDLFDNNFFGVSEREARGIDPQQRLLLELAWEALEDAGIPPSSLRGSNTGVFIGICGSDYGLLLSSDLKMADAYIGTGSSLSIAANRVSFTFDLHGPSLAVDTACSSSLVAAHIACRSLRAGEAGVALVGGVNIILSPTYAVNLTKAGFSSPDGRVRAFDAAASGYVRSEGGAVVVLKLLSKALADGDPVYAVIKGSALNEDGFTNGLTAPNRQSQEAVLRAAYQQAHIAPGDVQYVECHGTGTLLGDTIEASALGNVVGAGRQPDRPCLLGAVKTNLGHMEAAAGMASLIKAALALKYGQIPATLHYQRPNPNIPFANLGLKVITALTAWPKATRPAAAGVSAFGFGGSNAHFVLEQAPPDKQHTVVPDATQKIGRLPLSARSKPALDALANAYLDLLRKTSAEFADICYTAGVRRDHHDQRLMLIARTREQAIDLLQAYLQEKTAPGLYAGAKPFGRRPRTVFVFGDDLAGWITFGRKLTNENGDFQKFLMEWDERLRRVADVSPASLLQTAAAGTYTGRDRHSLLFTLQAALADTWRELGVPADAVVGVGKGEVAAAYCARALDPEAAARIAVFRDRRGTGEQCEQLIANVRPGNAALPFIAAAHGEIRNGRSLDITHWRNDPEGLPHIDAVVDTLRDSLPDCFLEIGPESLAPQLRSRFNALNPHGRVISLSDQDSELLTEGIASLYVAGHAIQWKRMYRGERKRVSLPPYAWRRRRFWIETPPNQRDDARRTDATVKQAPPVADQAGDVAGVKDATYEMCWQVKPWARPAVPGVVDQTSAEKRWLILADASGVGEAVARHLEKNGNRGIVVSGAHAPERMAEVKRMLADQKAWHGVIDLSSLDYRSDAASTASVFDQACAAAAASVLHLQALHAGPPGKRIVVTRGVHAVNDDRAAPEAAQAPVWGLARSLMQEDHAHPWVLADLDPKADADAAAAVLVQEMLAGDGENQVAWRANERYGLRLLPSQAEQPRRPELSVNATYLIVGGLEGMAWRVAHWLVDHGARRLVLMDANRLPRRAQWRTLDPHSESGVQAARIRELEARGVSVHVAPVEASERPQLSDYLATFSAEGWPAIEGVIYLPKDTGPRLIADLDPASLGTALHEQAAAAWYLQELLDDEALDFFIVVPPLSATLGPAAAGASAAAHMLFDALGQIRRHRGQPVLVIHGWRGGQADPEAVPALADGWEAAILNRLGAFSPSSILVLPHKQNDWQQRPPVPGDSPLLKALALVPEGTRERPNLTVPFERPRTELERFIADRWKEAFKLSQVGIHDNFFELGGDSLQAAALINRLQKELKETVHLLAVFEAQNIKELADYLRQHHSVAVKRLCPSEVVGDSEYVDPDWPEVITDAEIQKARIIVESYVPRRDRRHAQKSKNPRAIFILSPPRSGSTLFRVMLAGHPQLFAPPELELLPFDDLGERREAYAGMTVMWLEGATRALMEVRGCDAEEAGALMRKYEEERMPTEEFYRALQERIGGRILIDKTPSYSSQIKILRRAEMIFKDPIYIYLLRHPCGMIRSFLDYKMEENYRVRYNVKQKFPYSPRQIAEFVWTISHQNALQFLSSIPPRRQIRIRFEDIVRRAEDTVRGLCEFLEIPYDAAMSDPYRDMDKRMTDSVLQQGRMQGDQNFLIKHNKIDPNVADRWSQVMTSDFLGEPTRRVAVELGYTDVATSDVRGNAIAATPPGVTPGVRHNEAQEILDRLSDLSDQEVESLLEKMLS